MDLAKPISYNSLTINGALTPVGGGVAMSGYRVDEINVSTVEVAQRLDKRAVADGLDAQDIYLGGRHISAIVSVFGSTLGDFWDKTQDLLAAFSPTIAYSANSGALGFLPLDFYQPTADIATWPTSAYPSGIPLRYFCRPSSLPAFDVERNDSGGSASKGLSKRFRLSLISRQPWKVAQSFTTSTLTDTWTTRGDSPAYPYVYISATSVTGTWVGTMNGSAWTVNVDGSRLTQAQLSARNRWVLDAYNGILYGPATTGIGSTISDGNDPNVFSSLTARMDRLDSASTFPLLSAGSNTGGAGGGTLAPAVTTYWRDTFA